MKILLYTTLVFTALSLGSCEDDFLVNPNPNSVTDGSFGKTIEEIDISLAAAYGGLRHHDYSSVMNGSYVSDVAARKSFPFFFHEDFSNYNLLSSIRGVEERWLAQYRVIFRANQTLSFVEKAKGILDAQQLRIIEAQAKFLRGATHFYLHSTYNNGSIILRDKLDPSIADLNSSLSESAAVIASFRNDLQFAKENLPAINSTNYPKGRITAGAAATILGNSYLYQEEYDNAIAEYTDVMNNYGYSLVEGTEEVLALFDNASEFNSESIWEINYGLVGTVDQNGRFDEDSFTTRLGKFIGPQSTQASDGNIGPPLWLMNAYLSENDLDGRSVSLRTSANIAIIDDVDTPYYNAINFREYGFNNFDNLKSVFRKYTQSDLDIPHENLGPTQDTWQSTRNVILHRLPEVILNLAECYIKSPTQQNLVRSQELINSIRNRWNIQPITLGTADQLMRHIMDIEKPLELNIEGTFTRFIDLRRWDYGQARFNALATSHRNFKYSNVSFKNEAGEDRVIRNIQLEVIDPDEFDALPGGQQPQAEFELIASRYSQFGGYLPIPDIEVNFNENVN